MSDQFRGRQDDYRRALADPIRFDVAFYAGLYVETLEAEIKRLRTRGQELETEIKHLWERVGELEDALIEWESMSGESRTTVDAEKGIG